MGEQNPKEGPSQIAVALETLNVTIADLDTIVGRLSEDLTSALRPAGSPSEDREVEAKAPADSVPLAEAIYEADACVFKASKRLYGLRERLELP